MILNEGGVPLFTKGLDGNFDEALIGGFLSAVQNFSEEVQQCCVNKIETKENIFYYSKKGPILSIIVAEATSDLENRMNQIVSERLGRVFLEKYAEKAVEEFGGDCRIFEDFDEEYNFILNESNKMLKQSHKDFISKFFVEAAVDENIVGSIVFDLEKDEIIASDIPKDFSEKDFESFSSMLFTFVDRLGSQLKVGTIDEMLLRAKQYWIGGFRKGNLAVFMIYTQDYFGKILPDIVTSVIK